MLDVYAIFLGNFCSNFALLVVWNMNSCVRYEFDILFTLHFAWYVYVIQLSGVV